MLEFPAEGARPVWIASYPRSGNTFLRIILEKAFRLPTYSIYRVEGDRHGDPSAEALEQAAILPKPWRKLLRNDANCAAIPIKTHGPPTDDAPTIFIVRDGHAAIHSYYHYHKKFAFEQPSLLEVIAGACQFGSWSEHYRAWQPRTRPHTLVLRYDELVGQPEEIIARLSSFLKLNPAKADLPRFEELQRRSPSFFRRGQNTDYLQEWAPHELGLFNQLHGAVMQELGFPVFQSEELAAGAAKELAETAAKLHRLYLEGLSNIGSLMSQHAEQVQALQSKIQTLQTQVQELSRQITQVYEPLRRARWSRLGAAIGTLRPAPLDKPSKSSAAQDPGTSQMAGEAFRSSAGNTQSSSPGPQQGPPSVPSQGVSAPG